MPTRAWTGWPPACTSGCAPGPATHATARRVILNTWEAVYFHHDPDRLIELAERAGRVGVELFVLDDGWFLGRRDDTAGLGDWTVDREEVWPDGLHPLIKRVRELGMAMGLWVEPEMVSPNSDLARAHPDWILALGPTARLERNQLVLDVAHPDVHAYLLEQRGPSWSANTASTT